jgi:hypothetical protein
MRAIFAVNMASLFLGIVFCGGAGAQQVFKCQNASGTIEFSDKRCTGAHTSTQIKARTNSMDSSGSRELLLRQENEQLREQLKEQQKNVSLGATAPQRTQPDLQADRIDGFACEKAKRDYEITASSTSNSWTVVEAKRSIMYGTCGMREPDKNTTNVNNRITVR